MKYLTRVDWLLRLAACLLMFSSAALFLPRDVAGQDAETDSQPTAAEAVDLPSGIIVHLGCGDGRRTAALHSTNSLVHGLDVDVKNVMQARARIRKMGLYGDVSVDTFDGMHLPYAENLTAIRRPRDIFSPAAAAPSSSTCKRGNTPYRIGFVESAI